MYQSTILSEPFHRALVSVRALRIQVQLLRCTLSVLVELIFDKDLLWQGATSQRQPPTVVGRVVVP